MKDSYDRQIRYLRLSVTEFCNLRCRYCMPEAGVCPKSHADMLSEEEMIAAVRAAVSLGVNKVRITGGEPLVKKNILSICEKVAAVPGIEKVCITTNGTLLPDKAEDLKRAGVSRVNISLDTLSPEKYSYITRGGKLEEAREGILAALNAGFSEVKINCVLVGGFNEEEVPALAELSRQYPLDVRFIEFMPMSTVYDFPEAAFISSDTVLQKLPDLVEEGMDGVARMYRLPGAGGRIGLISAVSHSFCSGCDRIRMTADGHVLPCLHSSLQFSLKGLDEDGMREVIRDAIQSKPQAHADLSARSPSGNDRPMGLIGG